MPTEQDLHVAIADATTSTGPSIWQVVQRIRFASPSPLAPNELYAISTAGAVRFERTRMVVEPDARATTNTYFGRVPASYLQRWTPIRRLEAVFRVRGEGRLEVHASDAEGEPRILSTVEVSAPAEQEVRLGAVLNRFMDGGSLWVEVSTGGSEFHIEDLRWIADEPRANRPTSVVMCTFNRVDDCLATMRMLGEDSEVLDRLDRVYVVDQGTEPVESADDFAAVTALFGEQFHYIRQPNLGGAGGFTRGLYEVTESSHHDHANVLFMDDDVLLEPETVLRMTAFANHASEPIIVGGQMLYLYHPNRLHVSAETVDLRNLKPGVPVAGADNNIDLTEELPHLRVNAGYNAWWSCLLPVEAVRRVGFPLPVFFQWDDIEYGVRAGRDGIPTVTLPGSAVWHADFAWKDWDDWARYFSLRNSLIACALHGDFNGRHLATLLGRQLAEYLVSMQYGMAATLIKAVEDFLAGPDVLHDGGVEAAADIRALRARYPDTERHQPTDIGVDGASAVAIVLDRGTPSLPAAVLAKRLVYRMLGRDLGAAAIPARDAKWWHVSLFHTAVVTDSAQDSFRVRRYDKAVLTDLARRGGSVLRVLARRGDTVRQEWQEARPRLTDRENWKRLFFSS